MAKTILGIKQLALMGARWFAKPPETHSIPSVWLLMTAQGAIGAASAVIKQLEMNELKAASFEDMMNVVRPWIHNNGSTIFVEAETVTLCEHTESIQTVISKDIKPSMPFVYFCLPEAVSPRINGEIYSDCICCHNQKNHRFDIFWFPKNPEKSPIPLRFYTDEETTVYQQILFQHKALVERAAKSSAKMQILRLEDFSKFFEMVVNFLLVMQSYPQYVKKIPNSNRIKFAKTGEPSSFILARSKKKKMTSTVVEGGREDFGGTHDSPYSHWRRGHWRRQPHGDEWRIMNPQVQQLFFEDGRLFHMQWIEPMWVTGMAFTEIQG